MTNKFQTVEEIIDELNPSDTVLRRYLQQRGVFLGSDRNVRHEASAHFRFSCNKEELLRLMKNEDETDETKD